MGRIFKVDNSFVFNNKWFGQMERIFKMMTPLSSTSWIRRSVSVLPQFFAATTSLGGMRSGVRCVAMRK